MLKVKMRYIFVIWSVVSGKENAEQTARTIYVVYGDGAIAKCTVHKWFATFRSENFDLVVWECPGKPSVVDVAQNEKAD